MNYTRSLTFSGNKLVVPWTLLFDSKSRKPLVKLHVIFEVDEFDVLRVQSIPIFGPPIVRLDASHPSLTAFEISYNWKSVDEEDLPLGISVMFGLTLLGVIFLGWQALQTDTSSGKRPTVQPVKGKSG